MSTTICLTSEDSQLSTSSQEVTVRVFLLRCLVVPVTFTPKRPYPSLVEIKEHVLSSRLVTEDLRNRILQYEDVIELSYRLPHHIVTPGPDLADLSRQLDSEWCARAGSATGLFTSFKPHPSKIHLIIDEPPAWRDVSSKFYDGSDPGIMFECREVLRYLKQHGLRRATRSTTNPSSLLFTTGSPPFKHYFGKAMTRDELAMHELLRDLDPDNHHIASPLWDFEPFLPLDDRLVVIMPLYGYDLTSIETTNDVFDHCMQLCRILVFLHSHRIAHLDIKRTNAVVSVDGVVTLLDLGCATKCAPKEPGFYDTLYIPVGTPGWAAPEVQAWLDDPDNDNLPGFMPFCADVWSFGHLLEDVARWSRTLQLRIAMFKIAAWAKEHRPPMINVLEQLENAAHGRELRLFETGFRILQDQLESIAAGHSAES